MESSLSVLVKVSTVLFPPFSPQLLPLLLLYMAVEVHYVFTAKAG
jgi:hypothetical protein